MALMGLALFAPLCASVAWAAARRRAMVVRVAPALEAPTPQPLESQRERVEVDRR